MSFKNKIIQNFNFDKYIIKSNQHKIININIPNNFSYFEYEIYGNEGFYEFGIKQFCNFKNNLLSFILNDSEIFFFKLKTKDNEYFEIIDSNKLITINKLDENIYLKINKFKKDSILENIDDLNNEKESDSEENDDDENDDDENDDDDDEDENDENENDDENSELENNNFLIKYSND